MLAAVWILKFKSSTKGYVSIAKVSAEYMREEKQIGNHNCLFF